MSWMDDTGTHEGLLSVVFADGRIGSSDGKGGLLVDHPDGRPRGVEESEIRPAAAVVGWRVTCDHLRPGARRNELPGLRDHTWLSPQVWRRVYSPAEEDLQRRRVYASLDDLDSVHIQDRADVFTLIHAEWQEHIAPEDREQSIRNALDSVAAAKQLLDCEVAAARAAGLTWADIGRIAGITRQAARDRWGL